MFRLAAIGAKEGAAAGISKVVGTDITDATLHTTNGQDFKTVDEYMLYALMRAVIEGAELPATIDVRRLYVSLCLTKFDFRIKMVVNVERLRSQAAKSKGYGVRSARMLSSSSSLRTSSGPQVKSGEVNFAMRCDPFAANSPTTKFMMPHHASTS